MHQKKLLDSTKEFLEPEERKVEGVKLHDKYASTITAVSIIITVFIFSIILTIFTGYTTLLLLGGFLLIIGGLFEGALKYLYGFTGADAVRYYALRMYENPSKEQLKKIRSWNHNPFYLHSEYYYPQIGHLIKEAKKKDDPVQFVHSELPDILRLIERRESDKFNTLIDPSEYSIGEKYEDLIREANYAYKFGGYTSAAVLLRKIAENLIDEILLAKGLYTKLNDEQSLGEAIDVLTTNVIAKEYDEEYAEEVEVILREWIKKRGNKAAHDIDEIERSEIKQLVEESSEILELLFELREEVGIV